MVNGLLATKMQMTATYDARGRRVGATVLSLEPNVVTQVKTTDSKDGYNALQLGIGSKKSNTKPQLGHFKKAGIQKPLRFIKEVRTELAEVSPGQELKAWDVFSPGDSVKVTGVSKGRGFQGGMKRYGFHGGPKTHGQSDRHRAPGSIGSGTTPGLVYKGKKMAGHMGNQTVSTRNLEVIMVDRKNNQIIVKGAVPGAMGSLLTVTKLGRIKGYTPPPEEKLDEEEEEEQSSKPENETKDQGETASEQPAEANNLASDQQTPEDATWKKGGHE